MTHGRSSVPRDRELTLFAFSRGRKGGCLAPGDFGVRGGLDFSRGADLSSGAFSKYAGYMLDVSNRVGRFYFLSLDPRRPRAASLL